MAVPLLRLALGRTAWTLAVVALVLVAAVVGVVVFIAAARATTQPVAFVAAGLLAYAGAAAAGGWLLARLAPADARGRALLVAVGVPLAVALVAVLVAVVPPARPPDPPPPAGLRLWDLPDGTRLAATRIPATGPAVPPGPGMPATAAEPIVFLHGGPGVADMDHDLPYLAPLAATGHDLWYYDQLGSGRSSRLADPTGYSLDRDVADLEQVRQRIGADRVILVGHSYGATLAANYLARHPDRVAKVVFSSPGRMVPLVGDVAGNGLLGRLSTGQRASAVLPSLHPRAMLTWALTRFADPRAAHRFAGDREMDARFADLYRRSAPGLVCRGADPPPAPAAPGFYANQIPLGSTHRYPDIRGTLRGLAVPALVLKGRCDYLPWSFAVDYRHALPGARLVYFPDAGHQIYHEHADRYVAVVASFLQNSPLPIEPYDGDAPPNGYGG